MAATFKMAASMGSGLPDPHKDVAASNPIPTMAVENKPAPGQTGPKGLAPRTTYSRVNTGQPPVMDAGASAQKSGPNMGMSFLPAKVAADRGFMATSFQERPTLQSMVKAAMEGATHRLSVNIEAGRQEQTRSGVKTANAKASSSSPGHVSTELCQKLAGALGFISQQIVKEAEGPGEGPGALTVMQATSNEKPLEPGESGQATGKNQPPRTPETQSEQVQSGNAGTGLETNDDMMHGEQPVEPIKNASALVQANLAKVSSALGAAMGVRNAVRNTAVDAVSKGKALGQKGVDWAKANPKKAIGIGAGAAAVGGGAALASRKKEGSAPIALIRKLAEDAINPAHIDSPASVNPAEPPPGASASEEGVPSEPGDVTSQKRMIASNQAAIDYTKREAKADPKKDVAQVVTEPPLSSTTDKVLEQAFDATGQAGVKISSAGGLRKTAMQVSAQRVILDRLLKQASADVEKSQGASA